MSLTCLLAAGTAWGQDVSIGAGALPSRSTSTGGVQLSDAALLHAGVGAEAGYDSNVFYSPDNPQGSAVLRIVPFLELTNASRTGAIPPELYFDLAAALTYREYLSNDAFVRAQRAFMPTVSGMLEYGRPQSMSFGVTESFSRTEDPPYVNVPNQEPITRDVNQAAANVRWAPGGGRIGASLQYVNTIDAFETTNLKVANSMVNVLTLDVGWKWLPKTALVLTVSQGYSTYFNSDAAGVSKPTSFPLHVMAGIRGLITAKLAVNLSAGYVNTFYDIPTSPTRVTPSGVSGSFTAIADVVYRPTMLTSVNLGYRKDISNAILGDFYYVDAVYLNLGQVIASRLGMGVSARYESRSFQNVPTTSTTPATPTMPAMPVFISRHDNYVQLAATLDYHMRDWTYAGVSYTLMSNSSPYTPLSAQDPGRVNYFKQLVFARLGVTY